MKYERNKRLLDFVSVVSPIWLEISSWVLTIMQEEQQQTLSLSCELSVHGGQILDGYDW